MGLKYVQFKTGERLPLFAVGNAYDDSIEVMPGTVLNYTMKNAYFLASKGGNERGFINGQQLNGKKLEDMDGNLWCFDIKPDDDMGMILNIIKKNTGTIFNRTFFNNTNNYFWYLICNAVNGDSYEIGIGQRGKIDAYGSTTSGSSKYIRAGYINGLNGDHIFIDDVAKIKPEEGYSNCHLRNAQADGIFVSITGIYLPGSDTYSVSALNLYCAPYGMGQASSSILTLTKSVKDYDVPTTDDPYEPGTISHGGGGTGNFDGTSDDIDIPSLPTLSAVDTGFITLFNPSISELHSLCSYMWSNGFDLETFKKLFADPMDCILGLSIVPVAVPNGGSKNVSVGNISTGVSMTVANSQYVEVDCGTLNVNEYWGAYLDYEPYTKAEIYLPYIGTHPIAVDDIMGKAVHVVYHIDILSGACTAFVKCGGSVLYEFIGQCTASIPITGNDWTNVINGVMSIAGAIGTMVATGGASAPMGIASIASTATNSLKPNVEKSGSMSGTGGMLAVQTPYLILTRPNQALPSGQNSFLGYPSFITEVFDNLIGYTEIESTHLENIPCTESELREIEDLLKSGVIF